MKKTPKAPVGFEGFYRKLSGFKRNNLTQLAKDNRPVMLEESKANVRDMEVERALLELKKRYRYAKRGSGLWKRFKDRHMKDL